MKFSGDIESFEDFRALLHKSSHDERYFFRGESQEDFKLLPKIGRLKLNNEHYYTEDSIFERFKKSSLGLIATIPSNDWDWLSLAQHHGLPTRLLDWSSNPLVALFFCYW